MIITAMGGWMNQVHLWGYSYVWTLCSRLGLSKSLREFAYTFLKVTV